MTDQGSYQTPSSISFTPAVPYLFCSRACLLLAGLAPFARQPLPHRNEVVGREELGRERAPGAALDLDIDDIDQMWRQPQCDDLPDAHHHVPAHDLDARGRKALPPAGGGEVPLDAFEIFCLVVLEKDRQQDRLGFFARHARLHQVFHPFRLFTLTSPR